MEQYVKVERRYQKLEWIRHEVIEIAKLMNGNANKIGFDVEYPRGYSGSVDGFVTLTSREPLVINSLTKRNLIEAISDEPPLCEGGRDVRVEVTIDQSDSAVRIVFRVPDIWIWEDKPSFSERLKSQGQKI